MSMLKRCASIVLLVGCADTAGTSRAVKPGTDASTEEASDAAPAVASGDSAVGSAGVGGSAAVGGSGGAGSGGQSAVAGAGGVGSGGRAAEGGTQAAGHAGGAGPVVPAGPAKLGGVCATAAAVTCAGVASRQRLRCENSVWISNGMCDQDSRCDGKTGACRTKIAGCEKAGPACVSNEAAGITGKGESSATCGADLVTVENAIPCTGATPWCADSKCVATKCEVPPAMNFLMNPDFKSDVSSWMPLGVDATLKWVAKDFSGCSSSGALEVQTSIEGNGAHQCLPIPGSSGDKLVLTAYVYSESGQLPIIKAHMWAGSSCTGADAGGWSSLDDVKSITPGEWQMLTSDFPISANAKSVDVELQAGGTTLFDAVYLRPYSKAR